MNDPHVVELRYRLIHPKDVDYKSAPREFYDSAEFSVSVENDIAVFKMKIHYSDVTTAKAAIEPFLMSWEVWAGLEHNPEDIRLEFDEAEVVDRKPQPGVIHGKVTTRLTMSSKMAYVRGHQSRSEYPLPPRQFLVSPDVASMYFRFRLWKEGKDTLLGMANLCLSVLEKDWKSNRRREASRRYHVQYDVLDQLGRLCASGEPSEARKAPISGQWTALSNEDRDWIVTTVKRLIVRGAEYAHNPNANLPEITMDELCGRSAGS